MLRLLPLLLSLFLVACQAKAMPCTDPWGCWQLSAEDKFLIGALPALYGRFSATGEQALNEILTAVAEDERLLGHKVEVDWIGIDCEDGSLYLAAQRLVLTPNLLAVIGPTCPVQDEAVILLFENAGIPLIFPTEGGEAAYRRIVHALQASAHIQTDRTVVLPRLAFWQALNEHP